MTSSNVVSIGARPRTSVSRDARALASVLRTAHAYLDARPRQYLTSTEARSVDTLTWEAWSQRPARTSVFGHQL